jgi:hypothetical protein
MIDFIEIKNWKLCWEENCIVKKKFLRIEEPEDAYKSGLRIIDATVPGNFELDFMREGLLPDVYVGTGCLETQKLENLHFYYFAEFEFEQREDCHHFLKFEGIDTVAEIFVDGRRIDFVENMHHAHGFYVDYLRDGKHSIVVHILPVCIYARKLYHSISELSMK